MPTSFSADKFYNETVAKAFLQFYEHTAQIVWNQFMEATWNYVTNITKKNREEMVWYHLDSSPFSPCSSQGSGGIGGSIPSVPCPELEEGENLQSTCQSRLQALGLLLDPEAPWARISGFFLLVNITSLLLRTQAPPLLPLSKFPVIVTP